MTGAHLYLMLLVNEKKVEQRKYILKKAPTEGAFDCIVRFSTKQPPALLVE